MRRFKLPVVGTIIGLLLTLAVLALVPAAKRAWVRLSGAVIAEGSRTHAYADRPVRILSVEGHRWETWSKSVDASAYHALVIFPRGELKEISSLSGGDGFTYTRTERWQVLGGGADAGPERELHITYDALRREVTVGSQSYRLADGNLFVIRFDGPRPSVTQLETILDRQVAVEEVVGAFKAKLGEDEEARRL